MAAVAVAAAGRSSKRKSRRALAQSFLSRISLDGNVITERSELSSDPNSCVEERDVRSVDVEEETHPERKDSSTAKPRYMHSISESAAIFEKDKIRVSRTKDVSGLICTKTPEHISRRSYSLTDSITTISSSSGSVHFAKPSTRHRITCMSGSSFRLRRKLNDKRIVLCSSPRKVPFLTYSVLKYHKENRGNGSEGTGRKRSSAPNNQAFGIEGIEIGTGEKTVSYSSLLVPSFSLGRYSVDLKDGPLLVLPLLSDSPTDFCYDEDCSVPLANDGYEPYKLDDPELTSGKHRTVLQLSSYMVSVTAYAKPSELKKDLNERFREKFPHLDITLTKLRSLKKDLLKIASSPECQLDLTTVAYAYVYFEKLILKGKINKPNRKLVAGSCLLLAAKFNDDKREKMKYLIDKIEDKLRIQDKDLIGFEFQALVGLEFNLHAPRHEVLPHFRRLENEQQ